MVDQELSVPDADTTAQQKLYWLNALQVVGDWSVHDDGDGRLFYYDRKSDASQWEVPESLAPLESEFMMKLMLQNAVARSGVWTAHDAGNGTLYYFNAKTRESAWERPSEWGQEEARGKEQLAEDATKEEVPKVEKKKKEKKHRKHKKPKEKPEQLPAKEEPAEEVEEEEPLTADELQAEQERQVIEQKRVEQFRAMLRDKNIMPFCKWSVALPQIAGDPRFMGVPTMDERRAIFEHFVEHRRDNLKAEKKKKLKQAKKLFAGLLHKQFQLDSWAPSTTLSVFLSMLEGNLEPERYTQIQDDALALLTVSAQEKIYTRAVAEYKSDALKRDGEQLRLTKFLEEKLQEHDKSAMQWDSDEVQELVRGFYSSVASGDGSTALLSAQKQKQVFEELVARTTHGRTTTREEVNQKEQERSHSRRHSPARGREHSRDYARRESSPRRESRHSDRERHRYRSHSRRRRSRSDGRSHSRGRDNSRRSRRRSISSSRSRSRSRDNRSSRRSSRHSRHYSSSRSRSHSRTRR